MAVRPLKWGGGRGHQERQATGQECGPVVLVNGMSTRLHNIIPRKTGIIENPGPKTSVTSPLDRPDNFAKRFPNPCPVWQSRETLLPPPNSNILSEIIGKY